MSSNIDKEMFELYMSGIQTSLNKLDDNVIKLFERQSEMNITLAKNTVTVTQHHARSTRLENVQEKMIASIQEIHLNLADLKNDVIRIDRDVMPIKAHVTKLEKSMMFFMNLPKSIKFMLIFLIVLFVLVGIINGTITIQEMIKVIR